MKTKIKTLLGAGLSLLVTFGSVARAAAQNQILFNSYIPGTPSQVYAIDPDGTGLAELTNGKTSAGVASWHPSYQYISFFRDGYIQVMKALPEGKRVRPFKAGKAYAIGADFSPDGQSIVYCGPRTTDGGGEAIIITPVDVVRRRVGAPVMVWQGDAYAPSFSPEGTKILFSSAYPEYTGPHIKVLDLATGGVASFDAIFGSIPTYSADGTKIAFCGTTEDVRPDGWSAIEVFMMNSDFTGLTRLTYFKDEVAWPSFSPDGQTLVFTSHYNGAAALYQLSLDSGAVNVFQPEANAAHWTP